jgi:serine phosphatase RsbU (regulator of sigma subunit)
VSLIVGTLRSLAESSSNPSEILRRLNQHLHGRMRGGFATCFVLKLNADGSCAMANAGHPAPFINQMEIELAGAMPLGLAPDTEYEEYTATLRVEDHIVLYTDGLLEARTRSGELFSFERLSELMARRPNAEQATEVAQDFGQEDDITVLTITRLAAGAESSTQFAAPVLLPAA